MPTSTPSPSPTPSSSVTPQRRTRSERVALYSSSRGLFSFLNYELRQDHQGTMLLTMLLTAIGMCLMIQAWNPPMTSRLHDVTDRAIVCNTAFSVPSPEKKRYNEERARVESPHVFVNDPNPLVQLRESLWNTVAAIVNAHEYDRLDANGKVSWLLFLKPRGKEEIPADIDPRKAFQDFVSLFKDAATLDMFNVRLKLAFAPFEIHGLLNSLNYGPEQGNQDHILVYRKDDSPDNAVSFRVNQVLIRDGSLLYESLKKELPRDLQNDVFVQQLFNWLAPKLEVTLKEDAAATAAVQQKALADVKDVNVDYVPGKVIVEAGTTLGKEEISLLTAEYRAYVKNRTDQQRSLRFTAICIIIVVLFIICWGFVRRRERRRPKSPRAFLALMFGMFLTVAVARLLHGHPLTSAEWEILPLLIFVMAVSITYSWELAVVFASILILVIALGSGGGVNLLIVLLAVTVSATIQLGRLRSRRKLIVVSLLSGLVAFVLTISVGMMAGRELNETLLTDAGINLFWSLLAGLVMTGLLPFIEGPFGILTDMSLLELGDVSHPLLQSLIRLAPATYGHSMQVGTIAETAAEAIGARGLLTRVGAYFHDIGKIMKPEYYSENQGGIGNIHDQLEPQISTIVVIAHVKDGVDLARQHRLPQPLIDLIEQHHGTSLVSFFYGRATKAASKDDPQVEESTYRYPGPKPRTKEAAILMIADSCESACRSMGAAATPGKIENKVRVIIKQKLDDGQFDDSGLTLRELKIIENSVIKSIIAAMHGRIRYPGQKDEENPLPHVDNLDVEMPTPSSMSIPAIQIKSPSTK